MVRRAFATSTAAPPDRWTAASRARAARSRSIPARASNPPRVSAGITQSKRDAGPPVPSPPYRAHAGSWLREKPGHLICGPSSAVMCSAWATSAVAARRATTLARPQAARGWSPANLQRANRPDEATITPRVYTRRNTARRVADTIGMPKQQVLAGLIE